MTRSTSTPPSGRPEDGLKLDPAFANALTDLLAVVGPEPPATQPLGKNGWRRGWPSTLTTGTSWWPA